MVKCRASSVYSVNMTRGKGIHTDATVIANWKCDCVLRHTPNASILNAAKTVHGYCWLARCGRSEVLVAGRASLDGQRKKKKTS